MLQDTFDFDFELDQISNYELRIFFHYQLWFQQVSQKFGETVAKEMDLVVKEKSEGIKINRFSKIFEYDSNTEFEIQIVKLSEKQLVDLRKAMALNWLANDGIWFQEVENQN